MKKHTDGDVSLQPEQPESDMQAEHDEAVTSTDTFTPGTDSSSLETAASAPARPLVLESDPPVPAPAPPQPNTQEPVAAPIELEATGNGAVQDPQPLPRLELEPDPEPEKIADETSEGDEEQRRINPRVWMWCFVAGAVVFEGAAVWFALRDRLGPFFGAMALHGAAIVFSRLAAHVRRPDLSPVERDLVTWTGLLVPGFGPVIGWSLPRRAEQEEAENAHAVFERYADHVKARDSGYERTLFTGDYVRDLARELDVESYREVLRQGQTDQKRSALRRLAELGEARHFALIRECLLDPSHEVRLYAYSELERAGRPYEEAIADGSRMLRRSPDDPDALLVMARAYHDYAASGIQDPQMAGWYFRSADQFGGRAQEAGARTEGALIRASALARLGGFEEAGACLDALSPEEQGRAECCLVRAELAYRRRDFATVRAEAARFAQTGDELPSWLAAMVGERA